jgi:gluconokinase
MSSPGHPSPARTSPADAVAPLVLALDVGSTATRAGLYDATGREIEGAHHKIAHTLATDLDGASTIDPDQVVREVAEVLSVVAPAAAGHPVAAVSLATFSSSLVGVDSLGKAITPCLTYADARCAPEVQHLRSRLDESEIQRRTGSRIHASYVAPKLRWFRRAEPALFANVARWLSLPEYIHLRILGVAVAGTPTAAWTGLLNRHTGQWDSQMVRLSGIERSQLSPLQDPATPIVPAPKAQRKIREVWPTLRDADWFPGVADGLAASIGSGGFDPAVTVASTSTTGAMRRILDTNPTDVPPGLWCYRIDETRSIVGGALNDVGAAVSWVTDTLRLPTDGSLEAALEADPVDSTPLVLPFLSGERSTGWSIDARASLLGVGLGHGPVDIARGVVEGVALTYARLARQLQELAAPPSVVRVSGSMAKRVPAFTQILADALGVPVSAAGVKRATLRGAALLALETVAPSTERVDVPAGAAMHPRPHNSVHYRQRLERFEDAYAAVTPL